MQKKSCKYLLPFGHRDVNETFSFKTETRAIRLNVCSRRD